MPCGKWKTHLWAIVARTVSRNELTKRNFPEKGAMFTYNVL